MKKLSTILFIICLLLAPAMAMAWEKFDGVIKNTYVVLQDGGPGTEVVQDEWTPAPEPEPNIDLEELREEMGLEPEQPHVEYVPGIHVYETGYDDPIGLLVGFDGSKIMIFIPDIETVVTLDSKTGAAGTAFLYYESDDCTGQPYVHASTQYSVTKACDTLFTGKREQPKFSTSKSRIAIINNKCECWVKQFESYFTPAIEVPARTIGLYLPVALPLRFQAWAMPKR